MLNNYFGNQGGLYPRFERLFNLAFNAVAKFLPTPGISETEKININNKKIFLAIFII